MLLFCMINKIHVTISICQNIIFFHAKATLLYANNQRKSRRSMLLNVTQTVIKQGKKEHGVKTYLNMKVNPNLKSFLGSTFHIQGTSNCNSKMKICSDPKTLEEKKTQREV